MTVPCRPRMYVTPDVVQVLRMRRRAMGLSQAEVSRRAGYHRDHVSRWEEGIYSPTLKNLTNWAEALGLELALTEKAGEK